jgi:hypothetical protein
VSCVDRVLADERSSPRLQSLSVIPGVVHVSTVMSYDGFNSLVSE